MVHTISRTLAGGAAISIVLVIILTVMWLGGLDARGRGINSVKIREVRGCRMVHILAAFIICPHPSCSTLQASFVGHWSIISSLKYGTKSRSKNMNVETKWYIFKSSSSNQPETRYGTNSNPGII